MAATKILIVDDHILFRQGLASLLHSEPDFEICGEAGTVRAAIEVACREKPDLVLMDFELPDGNGVQAVTAILKELPACRVVFLTVHDSDEKLFEGIRSGARGYLLKDVPVVTLIQYLRAVQRGETALSPPMTSRILQEFARSSPGQGSRREDLQLLTYREIEVLRQIAVGSTNQEIGHKLFMAENTVKRHVHNILDKLALPNRRAAAAWAREHGLE